MGGDGNLLDGGPGSDILRGGSGSDTLSIDAQDLNGPGTTISGGAGLGDTLVVNFDLDLTGISDDRIANIGRVDLTSGASNTLTLNLDDVLAATHANDDVPSGSPAHNTLVVEGDSAADTGGAPDAVNLVGPWSAAAVSAGFTGYVLDGATVSVEADVAVATV